MSGKAKAALLMGALVLLSFLAPFGAGERKGAVRAAGGKSMSPPAAKGVLFPSKKEGGERGKALFIQEGRDWEASLFKVGGATLLVLVLAGGAVFLLSRIQPSRGPAGKKRALALVETLPLGRRKRLVLARASDRLLLLGETEKGISLLLELGEEDVPGEERPLEEETPEEEPRLEVKEVPFRRILKAGAAGGR